MASELPHLAGRVCLVTGASRGIGKGIALMLGKAGATVYITGRTLESTPGKTGSLRDVAKEIEDEGGICIPVQCDHGNDDQVKSVFDRIKTEQNGHLDVLVNNAYKGVQTIFDLAGVPFYEQPLGTWDEINTVGLRSNYVAAYFAAQMMTANKNGLIVNISSAGGLNYLFNIPYGVGKAANDRMMADMAIELKKSNVSTITLYPGPVSTELVSSAMQADSPHKDSMSKVFKHSEDPTFTGKAIAWLTADSNIMSKSGSIQIVAELAREYGFTDVGGNLPLSFRQVKYLMRNSYPSMAWLVPEFLYVPCWVLGAKLHKFKAASKM